MTLKDLKLNQTVKVLNIDCEETLKQRLQDLGLTKGTKITPSFVSPLGDPVAYEFRNNIIAIRNNDAKEIIII